jgi:dihydrofolate reductase
MGQYDRILVLNKTVYYGLHKCISNLVAVMYTENMISLVVARSKNNVIGAKNRIPWLLRADLVHLKSLTKDQVVVLGRKTYESMASYYEKSGREMPGKLYLIVTSQTGYIPQTQKTVVVHSIDEVLKKAEELSADLFVIGGKEIYKAMLPFADKLYITEVDAEIDGDTYFPPFSNEAWEEVARESHAKDEKNQYDYSFVTLARQKS